MESLINQIIKAKAQSGLSYYDLGEESGVCSSTIQRWLDSRKGVPFLHNFIAVAQCLGYELKLVRVVGRPESE